uniref:Malectin n=1 Tax=Eptatretus burgeri TaxID=7764 RepID=A0A8C4QLK9_EPTBU
MAFCFLLLLLLFPGSWADSLAERTVWAINAGGDVHTDQYGIQYSSDPLDGITGTASDYGLQMSIGRVPDQDQILYQTERWADTTFMYELEILGDGHYVIVLKFAEVYFSQPQQKVFDIRVNGHAVLKDLDIYQEVGRATALDVLVPLSVSHGRLSLSVGASSFHGSLSIEFVKGHHDNPKICAIAVIQGIVDDIPPLPPLPGLTPAPIPISLGESSGETGGRSDSDNSMSKPKRKILSGPRTPDPYLSDQGSIMVPILVAFGIFLPTLFCLCRL